MLIRRAIKVLRPFTTLFHNISRAADLARIVRRARNARYVANVTPGWRLICFVACLGLMLSSRPTLPASIGKSAERLRVRLTQGPPGLNLPNLNEARRINPGVPKMVPPVSAPFASKVEPSATAPPSMQENNWPMDLLAQGNRVGTGGEDLLSRNYNWGTPIVSLPGRAGMGLNLGLSLNSLIWTKSGTNIYFNLAKGFPSPGFHLGFPEIGVAFYNTETGTGSFLVTMPSGMRYEFRANPSLGSNVYEEMGGTHMLLVVKPGVFDYRDTIWNLLLTDGTVYKFKIPTNGNNPKCIEVKDRNGNFISITYTPFEQISAVTDNTGRIVNYKYDGSNRLVAIAQDWAGGAHNYATFAYDVVTIQTNFLGLDMVGAANGTTISALSRVDMADGKVYAFEYNTYAQVKTIRCYAPNSENPVNFPDDYTLLSYITYDLTPDGSAGQTDCPRFSSRKDWAKDWDAITENGAIRLYDGDGASWGSVTAPDGTEYKEFFGASGWERGLTLKTEVWSNHTKKKWTESTWANDDPSVSYWLNPRVVETNVYDGATRKRTKMDYADFGSVSDVREYDADATTVLRLTHFDYLRGTAYTGNLKRRLTQLVKSQTVQDGSGTLYSKTTFEYDLGAGFLVNEGPPIKHDTANFGLSFVQGRGDLNEVRRWDVNYPGDPAKSVASTIGYNTSGSVVFSSDPDGHKVSMTYADSFSDSNNSRNTFAYPTVMKDADQKQSTVQYNFDFGATTRAQDAKGSAVVTIYDPIGRILQTTNQVNGAYTRYVYAPNHLYVQSYTTISDLSTEFYQITVVDGYGRTRGVASEHPGSEGGYKARNYKYDIMGRPDRQTNPTEINVNWIPKGDDAAGFVWSSQAYDWQGQQTLSTNQEGVARSVIYDGCGCAGVQTVTVTDETGRRQREFHDVLGRVSKSQIMNWDGSIYSTTVNTYNTRDQVTRVREFKGSGPAPGDESCPTGICQETVMGFDGYSRLSFRKRPEDGASGTTYAYYKDDLMQTTTDARGASAQFTYNARHLTTDITYTTPNPADIPAAPNVSFQYDVMGNRTKMTDGAGTVDYVYDTLSRLTSETRYLSELAGHDYKIDGSGGTPIQTTYQIAYSYDLAGQLKQITTPTLDTIDYTRDRTGAVTKVSGTPRGGVTDYVSDMSYRAWGAEKSLSVGFLNYSVSKSYNVRMQIAQIDDQGKLSADFTYNPDGLINTIRGMRDRRLDRSFTYDHVGRATGTRSASAAGLGSSEPPQFQQDYGYDEFDHMTSRQGKYWYTRDNAFSATYTNNLAGNVTDNSSTRNWEYDAIGNIKSEGFGKQHYFDTVGREAKAVLPMNPVFWEDEKDVYNYDGDGRLISHIFTDSERYLGNPKGNSTYFLWSSVLNENLASIEIRGLQVNGGGVSYDRRTFIYVNGRQVASREYDRPSISGYISSVVWTFRDPTESMSRGMDGGTGDGYPDDGIQFADTLYSIDPLGVQAQAAFQSEIDEYWNPPPSSPPPDPVNPPSGFYQDSGGIPGTWYSGFGVPNPGNWGLGCYVDGIQTSCERALHTIGNGNAKQVTLSLNGAVGPDAAAIVASIRAAATSIDGVSTGRTRLVPRVVPGKKETVIRGVNPATGKMEVIDTLRAPDRVVIDRVYDGPSDILAISRGLPQDRIDNYPDIGHISETQTTDSSEKPKKSCGIKRAPEYNVSGTITHGTTFSWRATFLNDETHDPKACEVRQHISWNMAPFGGTSVPHTGFPAGSRPGVWYEDRDEHNNRYGRRTGPYSDLHSGWDWYQGNRYSGNDTPDGTGTATGFQFSFRLVVVDVFNGGKTIFTSRTLHVAF